MSDIEPRGIGTVRVAVEDVASPTAYLPLHWFDPGLAHANADQVRAEQRRQAEVKAALAPPPLRGSRNAPCPCGSGKKFKRCCMQSR